MSKKSELKRKIRDSEREIEAYEAKLMRSNVAVMAAIINKQEPSETDKEYFRIYTRLIEVERENLSTLRKQLEEL